MNELRLVVFANGVASVCHAEDIDMIAAQTIVGIYHMNNVIEAGDRASKKIGTGGGRHSQVIQRDRRMATPASDQPPPSQID